MDQPLSTAARMGEAVRAGAANEPVVRAFFDEVTNTATYVVHDPGTKRAAVVDSVLDFDAASGRTSTVSADAVVAYVTLEGLTVDWLLETHAHADHLSAAPYLQERLGGRLAIGRGIVDVQHVFGKVFNVGTQWARDGSEFDRLYDDGDTFGIGDLAATALYVPGHTPADMAYVVGDCAFVGDTLFMPDSGTARADFPGGDARLLYRSIRRLLALPRETRLFLCHDYKGGGRETYRYETTVGEQRAHNIHVRDGVDEDGFVAMRAARDATLGTPKLMLPAVQVNMRAGRLPEPEADGRRYLKLPLDAL